MRNAKRKTNPKNHQALRLTQARPGAGPPDFSRNNREYLLPRRCPKSPVAMNRSALQNRIFVPASASPKAGTPSFHFGSGRQYSTADKPKKCIIHRSQTSPALFGLRARSLSARLST